MAHHASNSSTNLNPFLEASSCCAPARLQCVGHTMRLKDERTQQGEDQLKDQEGDDKLQRTAMLKERENAKMQELEKDRED